MSRREMGQINVFEKLKDKQMKQKEAAKILNFKVDPIVKTIFLTKLRGKIFINLLNNSIEV